MNPTNNTNAAAASKPQFPEQVTGMYILAESLRRLGLMDVYGLVGIPVTEAAYAMQKVGINYYGFRFEQQAGSRHTRLPDQEARCADDGFLSRFSQWTDSHDQRHGQLLSYDPDLRSQRPYYG